MIDHPPRIDIRESLQSKLVAFLFERHPRRKRLLDDPSARAVNSLGNLIDLLRKLNRDMGSDRAIAR